MIANVVGDAPVKIVLERRVSAGGEAALEGWIHSLLSSAEEVGGLDGASVLASGTGEYFILLRFGSAAHLAAWQDADRVRTLFANADAFSTPLDRPIVRSGLETWFAVPGQAAVPPPPKWKMALTTWLALLPQAYLLALVTPREWPRLLGVAVGTALPVSMLTWFVMPKLVALLQRWLYAGNAQLPARTQN